MSDVPGGAVVWHEDSDQYEVDFGAVANRVRQHYVVLGGLVLIVAEVIWKGLFLNRMYLSQDDFVNLDVGLKSQLNWHYLSLTEAGHFYPGLRAITWVLARVSLYNWGLDAGLALALVAAASLAALRLLRTLFGDRPAILIPLALYALTPLTVPDLGWWSAAMESLPVQLAIFMALNAHVVYVRTRRSRHMFAATAWLIIGLLCFEKAIVLAPLMFAITAGFLMGPRSWVRGAIATLRRHWAAWAIYLLVTAGYVVVFVMSLNASGQKVHAPTSLSAAGRFAWTILKDTMTTGALGGPWRWLPLADQQYALAAPPTSAVLLSGLVAIAVVAVSISIRFVAWRAWAILIGWVVCADMLPVIFGRLDAGLQGVLGLETRYLADAACVLAICVGLAFLPVAETQQAGGQVDVSQRSAGGHRTGAGTTSTEQNLRYAAGALVAIFAVSSVWSVHTYENSTPGGPAASSYIANVKQAVKLAKRGTIVLDQYMPQNLVEGLFGKQHALESTVIGDLEQGKLAGKLRWIANPSGTIDGLSMFGQDGKLYPAVISGPYSIKRNEPGFKACWPERHGRVHVWFQSATTAYDWLLNITYIWGSAPTTITVWYGSVEHQLLVRPGTHSAYLSVSGNVLSFGVSGFGGNGICIANAYAGQLVPLGKPIP